MADLVVISSMVRAICSAAVAPVGYWGIISFIDEMLDRVLSKVSKDKGH